MGGANLRLLGDQLKVELSLTSDFRRLAVIDPSTGETQWHWNLHESQGPTVSEQGDHLVLSNRILRGGTVYERTESTAMTQAGVVNLSTVGDDLLLMENNAFGYTILQR